MMLLFRRSFRPRHFCVRFERDGELARVNEAATMCVHDTYRAA